MTSNKLSVRRTTPLKPSVCISKPRAVPPPPPPPPPTWPPDSITVLWIGTWCYGYEHVEHEQECPWDEAIQSYHSQDNWNGNSLELWVTPHEDTETMDLQFYGYLNYWTLTGSKDNYLMTWGEQTHYLVDEWDYLSPSDLTASMEFDL